MELPSYEGTYIAQTPKELRIEIEKFAHGCNYIIQEGEGFVDLVFRDNVVRLNILDIRYLDFRHTMTRFHNRVKRGRGKNFGLGDNFYLQVVRPWTVRLDYYSSERMFPVATIPWCLELAHALSRAYSALATV